MDIKNMIAQCKLQAADSLDPDYERFMLGVADEIERLRSAMTEARDAIVYLLAAGGHEPLTEEAHTRTQAALGTIRAALKARV